MAIGFGALFSNSVLLGLPIMERAYGAAALGAELRHHLDPRARSATCSASPRWSSPAPTAAGSLSTARAVARAMFRNALMIGLALGFAVNLGGLAAARPGARRRSA